MAANIRAHCSVLASPPRRSPKSRLLDLKCCLNGRSSTPVQCCQESAVLVGDLGPGGPSGGGTRKITSMRLSSISIRRTTVRMMSCMPIRSRLSRPLATFAEKSSRRLITRARSRSVSAASSAA